jgi:hypothetical protein
MNPISPIVSRKVELLREKLDDHLRLAALCIQAACGNLYSPDLWVNAATRRSLQLLDGFATMILSRNLCCCGALLRIQVDTAVRLFAMSIVEDADDFVRHMLSGGKLSHLKDRSGNKLTDRHLCQELSRLYPKCEWLPRVYEATCEFVHMSGRHVTHMTKVREDDRSMVTNIGVCDDNWSEASMGEAVDAFGAATDVILGFVHCWYQQKSSYLLDPIEPGREAAPSDGRT